MTLLGILARLDARRSAAWLAAIGGALAAWMLVGSTVSGTAVAVAWSAGAALAVAAVGAPLVAPSGTLAGPALWGALRASWPVAGMFVGATAGFVSTTTFADATLVLLAMLTGASAAVRCRVAAMSLALSDADAVSLSLAVAGMAALSAWILLPAATPPWVMCLAIPSAWGGMWGAFRATEEGHGAGRRVCSPQLGISPRNQPATLASPVRRILVAASMAVSLGGMAAGLFLVADAEPIAGWLALACFVAIAIPPALLPDEALLPALGRLMASIPTVRTVSPARGRASSGTAAVWWHAAILAWPPMVAALLQVREPARATAALLVALVPVAAAIATSIIGSPRLVMAVHESRLAVALVSAAILAAAALGH